MKYTIETNNNVYEVINWKRKDGLFNVYVQKTSLLSGTYIGENTYCLGVKEPITNLQSEDVTHLKYEI